MKKTLLSLAGSDPSGGAGIQADMMVCARLGVHGMAVPAALTVQNTLTVADVMGLSDDFISAELECLLGDVVPDAIKAGMLYTPGAVGVLARAVTARGLKNLVVDPVLVSSSGRPLALPGALAALKSQLLPQARVVTPNLKEAEALTGIPLTEEGATIKAASAILAMGPEAVVITGGHMDGAASDLYMDSGGTRWLEGEKLAGSFHGTGCAFSTALACGLAKGAGPLVAALDAKKFVREAMARAFKPGRGMEILGI